MAHSSLFSPLDRLKRAFSLPTGRAVICTIVSLLLYFFGNQTQVGWLYVISALMGGIVPASWWFNRSALWGVALSRQVGEDPDQPLHEGDRVTIQLEVRNEGRAHVAHVRTTERCALASPDSLQRETSLFVPHLAPREVAPYEYQVEIYRRGLHAFHPLDLASSAPFGLFRRRRRIDCPSPVLVLPELRRLRRLTLLDYRLALQLTQRRAGRGTEILGVRPFRPGDSRRHIHWRSVARTGRLISKEFADESLPGLTLALDLYAHPYPPVEDKHTPFEWAVKVAASIGDYACRKGYPLTLAADDDAWPVPTGPLTRTLMLEYLARVEPVGERRLADVLEQGLPPSSSCVAAVLSWPDPAVAEPLAALRRRGIAALAVLVDPASFPAGGPPAGPLADALQDAGVEACVIRFGEDWRERLEAWQRPILEKVHEDQAV